MVKTYAVKTYDVVLVSVNGAKLPDDGGLKVYLENKVYLPANARFNIEIKNINVEISSFSHGGSKGKQFI